MSLFSLGRTVATRGALQFVEQHGIDHVALIFRHASGDWGDLDKDDVKANQDAVAYGGRIFSSYVFPQGKLYILTEADRSSTCLMCAEEY